MYLILDGVVVAAFVVVAVSVLTTAVVLLVAVAGLAAVGLNDPVVVGALGGGPDGDAVGSWPVILEAALCGSGFCGL